MNVLVHVLLLYLQAWSKGKVAFVDFFKENATLFWESMIAEYHDSFPFDGVSLVSKY